MKLLRLADSCSRDNDELEQSRSFSVSAFVKLLSIAACPALVTVICLHSCDAYLMVMITHYTSPSYYYYPFLLSII